MAKGWKDESLRHSMAAKGMPSSSKKPSVIDVADLKISHRQYALYHAAQAREEVKKKNPDYTAIHYHLEQARYHNRFKPVYVLKSMVARK